MRLESRNGRLFSFRWGIVVRKPKLKQSFNGFLPTCSYDMDHTMFSKVTFTWSDKGKDFHFRNSCIWSLRFAACFLNWNMQIFITNKPIRLCMRMTIKTCRINGIIIVTLRMDLNAADGPVSNSLGGNLWLFGQKIIYWTLEHVQIHILYRI